jgi:hypothetical protein
MERIAKKFDFDISRTLGCSPFMFFYEVFFVGFARLPEFLFEI